MRISIANKLFLGQLALLALIAGGLFLADGYFMTRLHNSALNDALRAGSSAAATRVACSVSRHKEIFGDIAGLREKGLSAEKFRQLVSTPRNGELFPLLSVAEQEGNPDPQQDQSETGEKSPGLSGLPVFKAALAAPNQVVSGEIVLDPVSREPALQLACARIEPSNGEFLGVLLGQAPLSGIVEPLPTELAPKNGYCRVVAPDGKIVADPKPGNIMKPLTVAPGNVAGLFAAAGSASAGQVYHAVLNGEESQFTVALIPGTPWLAMTILPSRHYNNAPPEMFRNDALLVAAGLLLLVGIAAFFLAKRFSAPIRALAAAGAAAGRGEFTLLPVSRRDEIGELTESFNAMARQLAAVAEREKKLQAAEESARLKSELADRHKKGFLVGINHELRTPLTAILDISQQLEAHLASGSLRNDITAITQNGRALLELVDDLCDFSSLKGGYPPSDPTPFDLYATLGILKNRFEPQALAKGLVLNYHEGTAVPTTVMGDPEKLSRVLGYLLDNAVKFTENGEVSLRVRPLGLKAVGNGHIIHLRFEVADTGPGIALEEQTAIFELFNKGDNTVAQGSGLGIGLALARRIIERMDGTIGMKSEPGKGSTFFIEIDLPVAGQKAEPAQPGPATTETDGQKPYQHAGNRE